MRRPSFANAFRTAVVSGWLSSMIFTDAMQRPSPLGCLRPAFVLFQLANMHVLQFMCLCLNSGTL